MLDHADTLDNPDIMIAHEGDTYNTIVDAAQVLKVNRKTLRRYIDKGIVSKPPTLNRGVQKLEYFPDDLLKLMAQQIDDYRESSNPD